MQEHVSKVIPTHTRAREQPKSLPHVSSPSHCRANAAHMLLAMNPAHMLLAMYPAHMLLALYPAHMLLAALLTLRRIQHTCSLRSTWARCQHVRTLAQSDGSMGAQCCRRQRMVGEAASGPSQAGLPVPSAPWVTAEGHRVVLSPTTGSVCIIRRTGSSQFENFGD